jgi:hypothetical protein
LLNDNTEAYTRASPIVAWTSDDYLTASMLPDLFVFSRRIGQDTIYNFDPAAGQVDVIGYIGFGTFVDEQSHTAARSATGFRSRLSDELSRTPDLKVTD